MERRESERRCYFRIDENIALEYRLVDEKTVNSQEPELLYPDTASLQLHAELKKIDSDNAALLYQLKSKDRYLSDYLHNLNRKIDLLSQAVMASHKPPALTELTRHVNLSEGGIAFGSANAIPSNTLIALRMTFLPSYAGLVLYAKVIRCDLAPAGDHQIAAKFLKARESQLQVISQQIMRAQMADRRQQFIES